MQAASTSVTPAAVLDFWLADGVSNGSKEASPTTPIPGWPSRDMEPLWFSGGLEVDQKIRQLFEPAVSLAVNEGLKDWEAAPLDRLALVILLDQFTRNIFRGRSRAFSGDARAQQLVTDALDRGDDKRLPWVGRVFLYMPLMHAENLSLQKESVRRFGRLVTEAPAALRAGMESRLRFATEHHDIIARFGRFPYRNAAQGRTSTALEFEFLKQGPRYGQ